MEVSVSVKGGVFMSEYLHSDLTDKIIGLAIAVHRQLGNGFTEKIYQRALYLELKKSRLKFEREKEISVYYDKVRLGKQVLDFVVEEKVIVEIKRVDEINEAHVAQVVSYLKTTRLKVGLVLNFGSGKLEIRRVAL